MDYTLERKLLGTFLYDRRAFDKVAGVVQSSDFSEVGKIILSQIEGFYKKDPEAEACDPTTLSSRIERRYKSSAPAINAVLSELERQGSPANVLEELLAQRKQIIESRLGNILLDPAHTEHAVESQIQEWQKVTDTRNTLSQQDSTPLSDEIRAPKVADLLQEKQEYSLMPLVPRSLNELIGGVVPGFHLVVFARPETGKTGFAINLACGWLNRGFRVVHVCNEENLMIIFARYLARLSGSAVTLQDLQDESRVTSVLSECEPKLSQLLIKRLNPGNERELRAIIEDFKPDVMVIDQMFNLNEKSPEGLAKSSGMIRRLGGEYGVVMVSITQAGEEAAGKAYLQDHHIYMNKTAVQGDADILLGLGATREYIEMNKLQVNVIKNKVPGGGHGSVTLHVDRATGKLVSI